MEKTINKFKNQRLRLTLSIMVLSLCTVFLFLSNSAQAQTNIVVTNVEGVNEDGSNGDVTITATAANVYDINNVNELRALSKYVAVSSNDCSGLTFNLTADIDFTTLPTARNLVYPIRGIFTSASNFVPIGCCSVSTSGTTNTYVSYSNHSFTGTFNGNGHTIKGLRIFAANSSYIGLFGGVWKSGTPLKDIGIIDANITGQGRVGGLCGDVESSITTSTSLNIDNCYVKNSTINSSSGSLGGLIGYAFYVSISNCYADNDTVVNSSYDNAGGLVGALYSSKASNCYVKNSTVTGGNEDIGGLFGFCSLNAQNGALDNCYVESTIVTALGSSSRYVGGLIGELRSGYISVTNCYVKSSTIQGASGEGYGGFAGAILYRNSSIKNCYVTGTADNPTVIKGTTTPSAITNVGGFSGDFYTSSQYYANIYNCYVTYTSVYGSSNVGEFTGIIYTYNTNGYTNPCTFTSNCYTTAAAYNGTTPTRVYNFYGSITNGSCSNCYYDNGTAADGASNSSTRGLSLATMKTNTFANTTLNLASSGGATAYVNDYTPFPVNGGYPIFNGAPAASLTVPYTVSKGEEIIIPSGTAATDIPTNITISDGGSLIDNSNNVSSVTIQRKLKVGAWNLFGLTQSTTTNVGILNNNAGTVSNKAHDMAATVYDYTTNNWGANANNYLYANDAMTVGKSYFVWPLTTDIDGTEITPTDVYTIVSQTATPYTSDISMTTLNLNNSGAATTGNTVNGKWFSLNNPYTGKLKPNEICTSTSISNTQGESTVYTYNADNGAWEIPTYVYPGQGFMVASASDATTLSGTLTKATRTAKASETTPSYITFTCQANNTTKEAFARISEQASNGFDQKDAYVLLSNNNENLVEPYFLVENHAVLKNIYKTMPYYTPMNFHASKGSNTNLTVNNIPENVNVSIIDLSNGNETALENGSSFNFVANQGENEGRFVVKFAKNSVGIENNAEENNISLAMYPNPATTSTTLFIDGLTNDAQVSVCDVQGRSINNYTLNTKQSTLKINTSNLASGIYYIRVVSNNLTKTEKLIVK